MSQYVSDDKFMRAAERHSENAIEQGRAIMKCSPMPPQLQGIVESVESIKEPKDAAQCVEDMSLLEEMLKHAHEYKNLVKEYCILEAKMWIRIAGLDFYDDEKHGYDYKHTLGTKGWNLVQWIRCQSDDEIASVMFEVSRGKRIQDVRLEQQRIEKWMADQDEYKRCATEFIDEYKTHGETKVNAESFYQKWSSRRKADPHTVRAWLGETRNALLKAGAIGLGDGDGTYLAVTDEPSQKAHMAKAITNRLFSMARDSENIVKICSETGLRLPVDKLRQIRKSIDALIAISQSNEVVVSLD